MSLATRCTACGTIFRIVEDQLRVSDGWVRCGRCAEIFDARELLFDIERDAPPAWPTPFTPVVTPPEPPPPPQAPPPAVFSAPPPWTPPPEPEPHIDALPTGWPTHEATRQEPRWVDEDDTPASPAPTPQPQPQPAPSPMTAAEPELAAHAAPVVPEFMRDAERSARWSRPAVKLALFGLSILLAALLVLQVALHFRHAIAALHPLLRPTLQALCGLAGCEITPWKRIEALGIDATSLNPIGSGGYKLNLALRNKTAVDVAAPSVELSLTDANGAPLARRVLSPEAMSPALTRIAAESEQSLSVVFSTGGQRVSGYSVNIFYP